MGTPISLALELLADDSEETRRFAVRMLAGAEDPEADAVLARLVATGQRVGEEAVKVLRHRCPWLVLSPSPVMDVPPLAAVTRNGRAWQACREGMADVIKQCGGDLDVLRRYLAFPGLIADLAELLASAGYQDEAKAIAWEADLYGCGERSEIEGRQALVSPTYRCNIDCSYCYAKSWDAKYGAELPLERIPGLLDWLAAQNVRLIQLAGGEPTIYRHFGAFLREARARGITVWVTSNGLFPKVARDAFTKELVGLLVAHYDQEHVGAASTLRDKFISNITAVRDRGIEVILRYTLTPSSNTEEWELLLETAAGLGVERVNFGFAFQNFAGNNTYSVFTPGTFNPRVEAQFTGFAAACARRGIKLHQSKPMPLCMLSLDTLRPLLLDGNLGACCTAHRGGCTQNITVNPDLSTFPCNALGIEGPKVMEELTLAEIGARNTPLIHALHRHPFAVACKECLWFYRGFCQGACLVEHYGQLRNTGALPPGEAVPA